MNKYIEYVYILEMPAPEGTKSHWLHFLIFNTAIGVSVLGHLTFPNHVLLFIYINMKFLIVLDFKAFFIFPC